MTPLNLHTINSSLVALPVAMAYTRKLLADHKTPVTAKSGSPDDQIKRIEKRANSLTETLKGIVGYHHHGLNE